jgi:hypothetical protein
VKEKQAVAGKTVAIFEGSLETGKYLTPLTQEKTNQNLN